MLNDYEKYQAQEILDFMNDDVFNTTRPSSNIIEDLIQVIRYLDQRIQELEGQR